METNTNHTELIQNLIQFGLCPFDWSIEKQEADIAIIKNTNENDFQFIGKIDSTHTNWEYLKLHNI